MTSVNGIPWYVTHAGPTHGQVSLGHSLNWPGSIAVGDLALILMGNRPHVNAIPATYLVTTPGWAELTNARTAGYRTALWYRFYTGTEGATVALSMQNVSGGAFQDSAAMWVFRGVRNSNVSSWFESVGTAFAGYNTVADTGVTTLGTNRLAVNLVFQFHPSTNPSAPAVTSFTNETGGDWVVAAAPADGVMFRYTLQTAEMSTAGAIDGGDAPFENVTGEWFTYGLALKPNRFAMSLAAAGNAEQGSALTKSPLMTVGLGANAALSAAQSPTYPVKPGASARRGTQGSSVLLHRRKTNWSRLRYVQGR